MKTPRLLLFVFLFSCAYSFAGNNAPLAPDSSRSFLSDKKDWQEDIEKRSIYSRTFKTPDGRIIAQSSKVPLCYKDKSGTLQVIDCTLKPSANGWEATQQSNPSYLNFDGSTKITIGENQFMTYNKNVLLNGEDMNLGGVVITKGNTSEFMCSTLPISKKYSFNDNRIETDYIINNLIPTIANQDLIFSEEIELPQGFTIQRDYTYGGQEINGNWQGDLVARSPDGTESARFFAPIYYDAVGAEILGAYKTYIDINSGATILSIIVPQEWLNSPQRVFPVTIDPLVTGPTVTWAGGAMPSCFLPTYNLDSILVVIPGQICITGFWVQSTYDAVTPAVRNQGSMFFTTTCGASPLLTVTGVPGTLPGTGYLPFTNYRFPLACCINQSCAQQTIWLVMHLGRSANGVGCNTTYIYHNPFTLWPFSAYVEGRTVENYGQQWTITPTTVCSDQCNISINVYCRYGVPPYTVTHPWAIAPVVVGAVTPCSFTNSIATLQLLVPGCPVYCITSGSVAVPKPTITDACGNTVTSFPNRNITVLSAPDMVATPNPLSICSGDGFAVNFTSCDNTATFSWTATNATNGSGNITTSLTNLTTTPNTVTYTVTPTAANGCSGQTVNIPVTVNPYPGAGAGNDTLIYSATTIILNGTGGNGGQTYSWAPPYNLSCTNCPNPSAYPSTTTTYTLYVTENGCTSTDTILVEVEVSPIYIVVPNTFTPNGNGVNDLFKPEMIGVAQMEMYIFNRWGELLYSWDYLTGSWDGTYKGDKVQQGVYVWLLHATPEDLHHAPIEMTGTITVLPKTK